MLIILSAVLYAFIHVIAKPMLGTPITEDHIGIQGINPIALAVCVYILNGLFFTPIARRNSIPIRYMGKKNLLLLSLVGIAEVSALILYFFGLKESTAINASIFSNGEIIFSLLIIMIVFRERLQKKELFPFLMIVFGIIILPVTYDLYEKDMNISSLLFGDIFIILSGLFYAVEVNICKYVSDKIDAKRITQITSFISGFFALLLLIIFDIPFDIALEDIPLISIMAFAGIGLATLFFVMALKLIGGVRTILLYSTTAVFGIIFSNLLLFEEVRMIDIFSVAMVISGIYFLRNKLGSE
ncbi:MAG: DMT family transporter [Nitrosopumilus sp.]|nr:DMT family transporter [Nitrosopumilus sp.]MDH3487645.1 DMT family transporter [Nitrosopumilus sp.]